MDNLEISTMTNTDFENLSPVITTEFDDFWTASILKEELKNTNSIYIVAKLNNEIVGFAGIWKAVDDVHITNIVVKKDCRKLGIGGKLLEQLILLTKNAGYKELTLEVNTKNTSAINLYKKYGFKELGIRKKYYNNTDDAIIMTFYI